MRACNTHLNRKLGKLALDKHPPVVKARSNSTERIPKASMTAVWASVTSMTSIGWFFSAWLFLGTNYVVV